MCVQAEWSYVILCKKKKKKKRLQNLLSKEPLSAFHVKIGRATLCLHRYAERIAQKDAQEAETIATFGDSSRVNIFHCMSF